MREFVEKSERLEREKTEEAKRAANEGAKFQKQLALEKGKAATLQELSAALDERLKFEQESVEKIKKEFCSWLCFHSVCNTDR